MHMCKDALRKQEPVAFSFAKFMDTIHIPKAASLLSTAEWNEWQADPLGLMTTAQDQTQVI